MKRAYKYRFYPTPEHIALLAKTFGCVRFAYNSILKWRIDAFRERQERISYTQASTRLTELKKDPAFAWLNDVSCVPLQQSLRHQQTAFKNFFEGRTAYPAYKIKRKKQAAEFTASAFKYVDGRLYIAKSQTPLNVRWSRPLPSTPSRVTITQDPTGRYFVSCLCEFEPTSLPISVTAVCLDVDLNDERVSACGSRTARPPTTAKYEKRLALLEQRLRRKVNGSKNRAKARQKVARLRIKIADCRMDHLHRLSRTLINENQVVCVGSLMVKDRGCTQTQTRELVRQLQYKAAWAGRTVVVSSRCLCCSATARSTPVDVRHGGLKAPPLYGGDMTRLVISTLPGWQCQPMERPSILNILEG